jgi:eukaryotic-like serine/threonine-protein kinase
MRGLLACLSLFGVLIGGCAKHEKSSQIGDSAATKTPASIKTIQTKTGVEMVLLPAGEFMMGDANGEDDEKPPHRVELSAFYMDTCEVPQQSFQAIMGRNPSKSAGPDKPVEQVRWSDAAQYCNMRSAREGLKPCYDLKTLACDFTADGYRLPTEAEWEYACRAGTTARWSFGDDPGELAKYGWFKANAGKTTHPVKQKLPNAWSLYDMNGNVAEWCNDFYAESYETGGPAKDPRGPAAGKTRVLRGGSWGTDEESCRASARHNEPPGFADVCFGYDRYGFRCVRRASPPLPPGDDHVVVPGGEGRRDSSPPLPPAAAQAEGK